METIKNLGHLMLDLETMGNRCGCAIVSIGAVEFDIETGETGREFYERIDLQSCLDRGLFVNASTVYWWIQQNEEARKEICKEGIDISTAIAKLGTLMFEIGNFGEKNFQLWGNGASFDISILESAIYACGYPQIPWDFRKERDVRTILSINPARKDKIPFTETRHNPINDCKHQIAYICSIWKNDIRYAIKLGR
jgi:hypothetical protein